MAALRTVSVTVALAIAGSLSVIAGQTPARTASISGSIVSAVGNAPVTGATIVVAKIGGQLTDYRVVEADGSGQFVVRELAAGAYRLYAEQNGFARGEYGKRVAGSTGIPLTLIEGQNATGVAVTLTPLGAIAGRILDRGRPVPRVVVRAFKPNYFDGKRSLRTVAWTESDDRGDYRLFGLEPGTYVVSAQPPPKARIHGANQVTPQTPTNANGNRQEIAIPLSADVLNPDVFDSNVYSVVYHPGTTNLSSAQGVELKAGAAAAGINLSIVRALPHSIRGRIVMPSGDTSRPNARVSLSMLDGEFANVPAVESSDGSFELKGVPPGRYFLTAQVTGRTVGDPRWSQFAEVEVADRDLDGVTLTMQPGVAVTGRVTIDGRPATPADRVGVQLLTNQPITGYSMVQVQSADATFTVPSVVPGTYRLRIVVGGRPPWVKSAKFGIDDALDAGMRLDGPTNGRELEIAIGTGAATIDATVVDDARRPIVGALVVAVPDAARRNRSSLFRTATTDAQGRVHIEGIDPGEYRLFATTEIEANAWQDPALLRRLEPRGEVVRLTERGTATVTLRILQ